MSSSYRCQNCGQVVPLLDLDETGPVRCPSCQGAMRSGAPPVPPPAWGGDVAESIPSWPDVPREPARWTDQEDAVDIDIRRHELLPAAPRHAVPSSGRGKHVVWPLIIVGIAALRLFSYALRSEPRMEPINIPQFQLQMPNAGVLAQLPGDVLIQRATWSKQLPDGLHAARLILSGPVNPRIGIFAQDRDDAETTFIAFDGQTGANAGRIVWKGPVRFVRFSLSSDGSRLAVLLEKDGRKNRKIQFYSLPDGNAVGEEWYPFRDANQREADDVWFEMLGPDRMLTIFQQRHLELWSVPDGKRLYSIDLEPTPEAGRHALAISPDRGLVAVANPAQGFTFYATADGAVRGRTAALPSKVAQLANCAFSPDGKHLGCALNAGDPPQGQWVMWSCPTGALDGQWDRPAINTPWSFWDNRHLVAQSALVEARDGNMVGNVNSNEAIFLGVSTGRRLWYLCRDPLAIVPAVHVASIELRPQWLQNPVANERAFRRWSLSREGLSSGP
jgi:hypothetical protein